MTDLNPYTQAAIDGIALALQQARASGIPAHVDDWVGSLTSSAQADAVIDRMAPLLGWPAGQVPRYWKSGGPGRGKPLAHAPLPDAGIWPSPAQLGAWPQNLRVVEGEIALRLGQAIDETTAQSLQNGETDHLIDAIAVAIELVESRWDQQLQAPALLRQADQQCHSALILGPWQAYVPWRSHNWSLQKCRLQIGTQIEQIFQGTHSLGHPGWGLAKWLQHVTRHGAVVPAGTVVTTGNWIGPIAAQAGDEVVVQFDGLGEARVQF